MIVQSAMQLLLEGRARAHYGLMAKRPNLVLIDVQNVLHAVGELRCVMQQQSHPMAIQLLADYVADFPEVWLFEDGGERCLARPVEVVGAWDLARLRITISSPGCNVTPPDGPH